MEEKEICNECGRSVAFGSGRYVNRVPDLNSIEERIEMGKPFPEGGWLCAECEAQFNQCSPTNNESLFDKLELERRLGK